MSKHAVWWICCRETGEKIDYFLTREEAAAALIEYEREDKADFSYEPDFYEIVEVEV